MAAEMKDLIEAIKVHSDRVSHMMLFRGRRPRIREIHPSGGEKRTKESLSEATDVNKIMHRWLRHGTSVAHLNPHEAAYGDFSGGLDYKESLDRLNGAKRDFDALPARVRAACGNDPAEFLQIVFDPERREELEGLDIGYSRGGERDPGEAAGARDAADVGDQVVVDEVKKAVPQGGE